MVLFDGGYVSVYAFVLLNWHIESTFPHSLTSATSHRLHALLKQLKLSFTCAKMASVDELSEDPEVLSMTDFLEAFVRLAWGMNNDEAHMDKERATLTGALCRDEHCSCHTFGMGEPFER